MKMKIEELTQTVRSILNPSGPHFDVPDERLSSVHGLDTSYFRGPLDLKGDPAFERLLNNTSDPLHDTLQSITVPFSLLTASVQLFGDSLIEYHARERRSDLYRFYPPILITAWSAFEAWLRISSQILVAAVPSIPPAVRAALLEERDVVERNGQIEKRPDRRPVLERYWLLLKYGCNLEMDRNSQVWQAGANVVKVRNSLVHYNVLKAPSLTASQIWAHLEAVILLFIAPSTFAQRTLLPGQFENYLTLVQLQPLISEFEERPLHKGWPRDALIFHCPFDAADDSKYPPRFKR
jgi:hypothetical protein